MNNKFTINENQKSNSNFCRNNILDEKNQIYKIMAKKKK